MSGQITACYVDAPAVIVLHRAGVGDAVLALADDQRHRIAGTGVALPTFLHVNATAYGDRAACFLGVDHIVTSDGVDTDGGARQGVDVGRSSIATAGVARQVGIAALFDAGRRLPFEVGIRME